MFRPEPKNAYNPDLMLTPIMPGTLLQFAMEMDAENPYIADKLRKTARRHIEAEGNEKVEIDAEYFDALLHVSSHIHAMMKRHNELLEFLRKQEEKDEEFHVPAHLKKPLSFSERVESDKAYV